ncbi:MAG: hypothetical protein ABEJ06_06285 [Haloarculaceae archaeon]
MPVPSSGSRRAFLAGAGAALAGLAGCSTEKRIRACDAGKSVVELSGRGFQVEPAGMLQGGSGFDTEARHERVPELERAFGMGVEVHVDTDAGRHEKDDYEILGDVTREEVRRVFDEVGIAIHELVETGVTDTAGVARQRLRTIDGYAPDLLPYDRMEVQGALGDDLLVFDADVTDAQIDRVREFFSVRGQVHLSVGDPDRGPKAYTELTPFYGPAANVFMVSQSGDHYVEFEPVGESRLLWVQGVHEHPEKFPLHFYVDGERVRTIEPTREMLDVRETTSGEVRVELDRRVRLGPVSEFSQHAVFAALRDAARWPSAPLLPRACD